MFLKRGGENLDSKIDIDHLFSGGRVLKIIKHNNASFRRLKLLAEKLGYQL